MGCDISSLKSKKTDDRDKKKETGGNGEADAADDGKAPHEKSSKRAKGERDSLDIPVPHKDSGPGSHAGSNTAPVNRASSTTAGYMHSVSGRSSGGRAGIGGTPSPKRPQSNVWVHDELLMGECDMDDNSSSSSAPQLFRISPTNRVDIEEGSWRWWMDQLRRERVSRDGYSRNRLQDTQNRLICQHDEEATSVELDFGRCYMERTAPYILGKLFASPTLKEIRWITSLRLDGNYFTDHGFGNMLATMSEANEKRTAMPLLEQLYLNNMNLDRQSVVGIFFFLFPVDFKQEKKAGRRLGPIPEPSMDFAPHTKRPPTVPLFPSLSILSLSDNPGLGSGGLAALLRWLLATHLEPHVLSALDLSRCGIDRSSLRILEQYFTQLPVAITDGRNPVMPRSLVLLGNQHGIQEEADVNAPEEIRLVL